MIKVLRSVVTGPLEPYAAGFAGELERQGYSAGVAAKQVGLTAHLSRRMAGEGMQPADLSVLVAERYAAVRRAGRDPAAGCPGPGDAGGGAAGALSALPGVRAGAGY